MFKKIICVMTLAALFGCDKPRDPTDGPKDPDKPLDPKSVLFEKQVAQIKAREEMLKEL